MDSAHTAPARVAPDAAPLRAPRGKAAVAGARVLHGVLAALVVLGVGIQWEQLWADPGGVGLDPGRGRALAIVTSISYFTIVSNLLVVAVCALLVLDPQRRGRRFAWLRLTSLVMITVTALVYTFVLSPGLGEVAVVTGRWDLADTLLHHVVPVGTLLGWLLFGPRPLIQRSLVPATLVLPTIWILATFVRGVADPHAFPLDASYPYGFLDVEALGYVRALVNTAWVVAFGLLLAAGFALVDEGLSGRVDVEPAA